MVLEDIYIIRKNEEKEVRIITNKYNQDGSVSQQWIAEMITAREGGVKEVNIGQVKEVLKCTLEILADLTNDEITTLLEKHD